MSHSFKRTPDDGLYMLHIFLFFQSPKTEVVHFENSKMIFFFNFSLSRRKYKGNIKRVKKFLSMVIFYKIFSGTDEWVFRKSIYRQHAKSEFLY